MGHRGSHIGAAAAAMLGLAIAVVLLVSRGPAHLYDGECLNLNEISRSVVVADCSEPNEGKVISIVDAGKRCPPGTDIIVSLLDDPDRELCVDSA
jgi:hypothetical protein